MYGAQIAFRRYSPVLGFTGSEWVGFDNISRFLTSPMFSRVVVNTISLSLYGLIAGFPFPILLALGLNYLSSKRFKKLVQLTTYMPHFISTVVIVGIMFQLLGPRFGLINNMIRAFGGNTIDFFSRPQYFRSLYVWSGVWQSAGWGSIIYIATLSSIDPQLYEAAIVDGASKIKRIWYIDIPGLLPTAIILLILNLGGFLSTGFEKVFLMQTDLNLSVAEVIDTYVYKVGLASQSPNFSYATAIGLFQSVVGFILVVSVNKIAKMFSETSLF
jgi:ABC-type polysaccharide transport system permease subunit